MQTYYVLDKKNDSLTHHGIKGQKWGVRRYQNADGSLTEEGYKRYGHGLTDKNPGIFSRNTTKRGLQGLGVGAGVGAAVGAGATAVGLASIGAAGLAATPAAAAAIGASYIGSFAAAGAANGLRIGMVAGMVETHLGRNYIRKRAAEGDKRADEFIRTGK